jgi:murein DD-endopeptidase MepM/ murein hydrolase activator NlpD
VRRAIAPLAAVAALAVGVTSIALAQHAEPPTDAAELGATDAGVPPDATPLPESDAGVSSAVPTVDGPVLPPGVGPITWSASTGRRCRRHRGRRVCEGPRRVPEPSAEALERQRALGLDQPRAAHVAIDSAPPDAWVGAVPGDEAREDLLWPVDGGRMWRGFGRHRRLAPTKGGRLRRLRGTRVHEGVDIGADSGTSILAADDGLVVYSDNGMRGYGNVVVLVHRNGSSTLYAPCSATYVASGELVRRGQIIAAVGATGLAHGAHLHFEWHVGGRARDPLRRFVGRPDQPGDEDAAVAEDAAPPAEEPPP